MYIAIASMWITNGVYAMTFLSWVWEVPEDKKCVTSLGNYVPPIYMISSNATYFLLTLTTLLVTYACVWRVAKMHAAKVGPCMHAATPVQQNTDHQTTETQRTQPRETNIESKKAPKFLMSAIGAYLLTWTMTFCVRIAEAVHPELTEWEPWMAVKFTAINIAFSNSCVNIFIYSCYLSEFRIAYRKILCGCMERQEPSVESGI